VGSRYRRRKQPWQELLLEGAVTLGAFIGLWTALSHSTHTHIHRCTQHEIHANTCIGDTLAKTATPWLSHLLVGAAIGLAVAAVIVLGYELLRRKFKPRRPERVYRRERIPQRVRHEVWRRDRGACVDCGSREHLEFDHIIPVSRGGATTVRNLELRCARCNGRKGARI
jgi:hypothetical protein